MIPVQTCHQQDFCSVREMFSPGKKKKFKMSELFLSCFKRTEAYRQVLILGIPFYPCVDVMECPAAVRAVL